MNTAQLTGWQRLIRFLFAPSVQVGGVRGGSGLIDEPRPLHLRVVREPAEATAPGTKATPWVAFQGDHWGRLNTLNPASGLPMVGGFDIAGNSYGFDHQVNPASGLPMVGLVDIAGNPYGCNSSTSL